MAGLSDFVGTWRAERGAPFSIHTFTWEETGTGLRGRWVIEAPDSPAARAPTAAGMPKRFEMQVGDPWLESGLLAAFCCFASTEARTSLSSGLLLPTRQWSARRWTNFRLSFPDLSIGG